MQINFGVGFVIGKRTDVSNAMPAFFGVTQEWELNIDQKLVTLMGAYKDAVDVAPAERTITGKVKFARLQATTFGNMLLGITPTAASGFDMITNETKTTTLTTYTVAGGALYTEDLGIYYAATGIALQPVAAAPATGSYIAGVSGVGTYTIAAGDSAANLLQFFYMQTTTTQYQMTVNQALMGSGPTVELNFSNPYSVQGVVKKLNIQVPAARISKMPFQLKNAAYLVPEMDFTAFMTPANTILSWAMTE